MKNIFSVFAFCVLTLAAAAKPYDFIDGFRLTPGKDYTIKDMKTETEDYFQVTKGNKESFTCRISYDRYEFNGTFKEFVLLAGRSIFADDYADEGDEQLVLSRAAFAPGVKGYWLRLTMAKKLFLLFAVNLEASPGAGLAMFFYSNNTDSSVADQEKSLKALLENLRLEFMDAAG